jgi:hypothetical protein
MDYQPYGAVIPVLDAFHDNHLPCLVMGFLASLDCSFLAPGTFAVIACLQDVQNIEHIHAVFEQFPVCRFREFQFLALPFVLRVSTLCIYMS